MVLLVVMMTTMMAVLTVLAVLAGPAVLALSLNEESLGNRRIRVEVADQAQDKDRDDRCFSRDRDRFHGSERFESDWRARPATTDSFDDDPPRRGDDSFGDRYWHRYDHRCRDGPWRDMDHGFGGRDRYDDRSRDYDRGYDSRPGSGRRAFGSGFRRDDDYRGCGDRYEDRYDRRDRWNSRDDSGRDGFCRGDRGPTQRPKLNLKPRSVPKEEETSVAPAPQSSCTATIFGGAKPVDTAAREWEVEERLQKEQEKLQRQLEDDKRRERRPRERHPSWQSEENQERSWTESKSSQTGNSGPPGTSVGTGPTGRTTRRRESEKSLENESFTKEDDAPSPTPKPREEKQPLKVMPAAPPKENAWVRRSSNPPARSQSPDSEQRSPTSGTQTAPGLPVEDGAPLKNAHRRGDENKPDGGRESGSKVRSGSSGRGNVPRHLHTSVESKAGALLADLEVMVVMALLVVMMMMAVPAVLVVTEVLAVLVGLVVLVVLVRMMMMMKMMTMLVVLEVLVPVGVPSPGRPRMEQSPSWQSPDSLRDRAVAAPLGTASTARCSRSRSRGRGSSRRSPRSPRTQSRSTSRRSRRTRRTLGTQQSPAGSKRRRYRSSRPRRGTRSCRCC